MVTVAGRYQSRNNLLYDHGRIAKPTPEEDPDDVAMD